MLKDDLEKDVKYYPKFDEKHMVAPTFELGMTYANATKVRNAFRNHRIKYGRKVFFTKKLSDKI